jgi:hypothetical protein
MRNAHRFGRPARSRPRRLAFAATALLAGCATAGREAATVQSFAGAAVPGQTSGVLFRVVPPGAAAPAPIRGARLWRLDGITRTGYAGPVSPSRAARHGGWLLHTHLQPGTWFMRLEGAGGSRAAAPADVTFRIPPAPPAVTYIGTFRVDCDAAAARPCRVNPAPADESAAAAALVAAEGSGVAAPVTALARPYPPSLAATSLAAPSVPASDLTQAVALARREALAWASSPGGIAIAFAGFTAAQGLNLTRVQYRAVPEMLNDLAEGRLHLAVMPLATALPQAQAGRLKLLAVTNATRSPAAPEVPTAAEQGFPTYVFEGFVGVFADARQPAPVRQALEQATREVVGDAAFAARVGAAGQLPFAGGADDLAARIAAQRALVDAGLRHLPPGG